MPKNLTSTLTPKQANYVKNRVKGLSQRKSALKAGYTLHSANTASRTLEQNEHVQAEFQRLMRNAVPAKKLVKVVKEGLAATKTLIATSEGIITDTLEVPDHASRERFARLAAEYGQYVAPSGQTTNVSVQFNGTQAAKPTTVESDHVPPAALIQDVEPAATDAEIVPDEQPTGNA